MTFSTVGKLVSEALESELQPNNPKIEQHIPEAMQEIAHLQKALGQVMFLADEDKVSFKVMQELGLLSNVLGDISNQLMEATNRAYVEG